MNPLALELNEAICDVNPHVVEVLSELGRNLYFPKGILTQSAEAKTKATRANATIGTALDGGMAMNLPSVMAPISGITPNDALLYAPSPGVAELRETWASKMRLDNPALEGKGTSLPVVTSGLTHGLSVVADMFIDPGDILLLPNMIWGNYKLIFSVRRGADIRQYNFFKGGGFEIEAFRAGLAAACRDREKVVVLLNYPNNPTGYTPTESEGQAIADALIEAADDGTHIVALTDDAYFSLFYGEDVMRQSLFTKLAGAHPRLLAIKGDAATKEVYVWGLRVGFLTYSVGGVEDGSPLYDALEKKTGGCIRGTISNCCRLSQTIVQRAIASGQFYEERATKVALMERRAMRVKEVLSGDTFADAWEPYPFNSGYFMCLKINRVPAEALRVHALNTYGIGTIAIGDTDLRIAFSCLEVDDIEEVFGLLFQAWKDLADSTRGMIQ